MDKKVGRGKSRLWTTLFQFMKFALVGISNTVISWSVYALCVYFGPYYLDNHLLEMDTHCMVGTVLGFLLSVLNAFYWNNKYVFKQSEENGEKRVWWKALFRTYVAYGTTGLVLNGILLVIWLRVVHIERLLVPVWRWIFDRGIKVKSSEKLAEYIAPIFNYVITIPLNFIINKFWAYGDRQGMKKTALCPQENGDE